MIFREEPHGMVPFGFAIGLIVAIGILALVIFVSQYIYKDAVKRKLNAELWLLIVLVAPGLSWIIYFLVRKTATREVKGDLKVTK